MQRILTVAFVLSFAVQAQADLSWMKGVRAEDSPLYRAPEVRTVVVAKSPYRNPYFQPNSNYEPVKVGEPTFVTNEFTGKLGRPPRPFTDIMVKGTYTIKKPEPPQPYVGRR